MTGDGGWMERSCDDGAMPPAEMANGGLAMLPPCGCPWTTAVYVYILFLLGRSCLKLIIIWPGYEQAIHTDIFHGHRSPLIPGKHCDTMTLMPETTWSVHWVSRLVNLMDLWIYTRQHILWQKMCDLRWNYATLTLVTVNCDSVASIMKSSSDAGFFHIQQAVSYI